MFEMFKVQKEEKMPKHIAITTHGKILWSKKHNKPVEEVYDRSFSIINELIKYQIKLNIPILTFYLLSNVKDYEHFSVLMDKLVQFIDSLGDSSIIKENRIKISVLGKWYDLPGRVVDSIKRMIDQTKDYDSYFLNFCINYEGQEEILDSVRLISRQIKLNRLDPDAITKEMIKENLYSSYFVPPDLIIINGLNKKTSGVLLWDSANSYLFTTNKLFPDFSIKDFISAIELYPS